MTKHMQWEAGRKTTQLGSTTVTEIELTPEAKERMTINVPKQWEINRSYTPQPPNKPDLFDLIFGILTVVIVLAISVLVYIAIKKGIG